MSLAAAKLFDMSNDTVLITGGGTGLGKRFAKILGEAGATVILTGRRIQKLEEAAQAVVGNGGSAYCVQMDVGDAEDVVRAVNDCEGISPLTVLVNNAGVSSASMLLELDEAGWDSVMNTNLKGSWLVAREVARAMEQRNNGGAIVNIASVLSSSVQKGTGAYGPSKAGLLQLTRLMAVEWSRYKIRVNAIAPGYYYTDIASSYLESDAGKELLRRIPARRLGDPSELDAAILLLASRGSSYMTGSVLTVDGGLSLSIV